MTARVDQRILKGPVGQYYSLAWPDHFSIFLWVDANLKKNGKSSLVTRDYSQSHTDDMHVMCSVA